MISKRLLLVALFLSALLAGCAHPIAISPDVAKIEPEVNTPQIKKSVGYFIIPGARETEFTTPGGGGDKVSYKPYRDLETSLYSMLSNVFTSVNLMNSATDKEAIDKYAITLVVTPQIATSSSSPSAFTWPPTRFSVTLTCTVYDPQGKLVASKVVTGEGHAEYDEFKSDFPLAARRASLDAMKKMQTLLLSSPELRN